MTKVSGEPENVVAFFPNLPTIFIHISEKVYRWSKELEPRIVHILLILPYIFLYSSFDNFKYICLCFCSFKMHFRWHHSLQIISCSAVHYSNVLYEMHEPLPVLFSIFLSFIIWSQKSYCLQRSKCLFSFRLPRTDFLVNVWLPFG